MDRNSNALVVEFGPDGRIRNSVTWGGSGNDTGESIAIGPDGAVYVGVPQLHLTTSKGVKKDPDAKRIPCHTGWHNHHTDGHERHRERDSANSKRQSHVR